MLNYPAVAMSEVAQELKRTANIGLPVAAMSLVAYLKNMISVVCMGKLGGLELAGGALAIGFTNITGYSVLSGLAMGMEPLCSQSLGSNNTAVATSILHRTILMLLIASLPIALLWFNLEYIMIALHQDAAISSVAGLYCRWAIPDLIALSFLHPLRIYLRSKGTTWPLLWSALSALLLNIPVIVFLPFKLELGVQGVAIANFIADFSILVVLIAYVMYTTKHEKDDSSRKPLLLNAVGDYTEPSWFVQDLPKAVLLADQWGTLLKLAIPSCLGVCLEWWWYEFMTLLAGYMQDPQVALATSAIVIQTTSLLYTLPNALGASVSSRVGNELGAGRPNKARLATMVAVGVSLFGSVVGLVWTTLGREAWGRVFANDEEVVRLTTLVLPIIGLCEIANCPQTTGCGALRGSARPSTGALINLCSFYIVGMPIAILLAFVLEQGYVGLCYGLLAAQIACVISVLTVICKTDWERESARAMDLVTGCDSTQSFKCDLGGFLV